MYCTGASESTRPFCSRAEQDHFTLLCLKLLITHLSLAEAGALASAVLGAEAQPMRTLLFRCVPQILLQLVSAACVLLHVLPFMCSGRLKS